MAIAYLSNWTARDAARMDAAWLTGTSIAEGLGIMAVWEAEHILANTEPMRPGCRMADRCYLGPTTWMGLPADDAGLALAEALVTFVACTFDCPHTERASIFFTPQEQHEHDHYCYNLGGHQRFTS